MNFLVSGFIGKSNLKGKIIKKFSVNFEMPTSAAFLMAIGENVWLGLTSDKSE